MENEAKIERDILGKGKFLLSVFLAGSGLVMWLIATVFNPQTETKQNVALIQRDVSEIKEDIKDFTSRVVACEKDGRQFSDRLTKIEATVANLK